METDRRALRAAVAVRVGRVRQSRELAVVVEPDAYREAQQLASSLRDGDGDLESRLLLGWLHWYRHLTLPAPENWQARSRAIEFLTVCFVAGLDCREMPDLLLPDIVDRAAGSAALTMLEQAFCSSDPQFVTATVHLWRRIVANTRIGHLERPNRLTNLAAALNTQFHWTGVHVDLDEAIEAGRDAAAATWPGDPDYAVCLSNLGLFLKTRFEQTGDRTDLDEAIDAGRHAVNAAKPDNPAYLHNFGLALQIRFHRTGDQTDLNEAIDVARRAVAATPDGDPTMGMHMSALGSALGARFEQTAAIDDLNDAVDWGRRSVAIASVDDRAMASHLSNLGLALLTRFQWAGSPVDLDDAVDAIRRAVATVPAQNPDRAGYLINLGGALMTRYEQSGDLADLNATIDLDRVALPSIEADRRRQGMVLSNLGGALQARFRETGSRADLDEAIELGRQAASTTPDDDPDLAKYLANLGTSLLSRFELAGALTDINEAIEVGRRAVDVSRLDPRTRLQCLSNLGIYLRMRFERTGAPTDLDEAIEFGRRAVAVASDGVVGQGGRLSNLALALSVRFGRTQAPADLDDAIQVLRDAVTATPVGHHHRGNILSNLGDLLRIRFGLTRVSADLDDAIEIGRAAIAAVTDDNLARAGYLCNLGLALRARYERTGDRADLIEAIDNNEQAAQTQFAPPSVRIDAAATAGRLLAEFDPARAARLLAQAVQWLPEVTARQLERGDQQHALGQFPGLASDAAALALDDPSLPPGERAGQALRLLEAGRAVLLGQALHVRHDLTDLENLHPHLALRFTLLRDQLDRTQAADGVTSFEPGYRMTERQRQSREFDEVVTQIRALEGFATFAAPPTVDELCAQAEHGPVVVFNISRYRSDALLLTTAGVRPLPLPTLTLETVADRAVAFHQALHTVRHSSITAERRSAQKELSDTLEWLWDHATGPALEALGYRREPPSATPPTRIWWVPGGLLGLLPLHAAGYHTSSSNTVMDRVVSSYTPTVAALRYARRTRSTRSTSGTRALVVAMPTTPGVPGRLGHIADEAHVLAALLPDHVTLTESDDGLASDDALPTKATVLNLLPTCPIAHFACHGVSDPADPSQSRLLLQDHRTDPLTVAALAPVQLATARLAYLSACETALTTDTRLLDESIHLAAAFQLAGYPHVVGTLWAIDDHIAVQIAEAFYTALITELDVDSAALALHRSVRTIRDQFPATPSLWAAHIHAGA